MLKIIPDKMTSEMNLFDSILTQVCEEINVKKVSLMKDDFSLVVEHDPIKHTHSFYGLVNG